MNNLSWLIYAADVCENLRTTLGVAVFILIPTIILCFLFALGAASEGAPDLSKKTLKLIGFVLVPFLLFIGIIGTIIPDKETIYAIAISEMGEEVLDSNIANKSMKALETWLDNQIDDLKGEVHEEVIEKEGK